MRATRTGKAESSQAQEEKERIVNTEMKILIAYDGSHCADVALDDLYRGGLPREAAVVVFSVADVYLLPLPMPLSDETRVRTAFDQHTAARRKARVHACGGSEENTALVHLVIGVDGLPDADAAIRTVTARVWPQGNEARLIESGDQAMVTAVQWKEGIWPGRYATT